MLPDAGRIQRSERQWKRRVKKKGLSGNGKDGNGMGMEEWEGILGIWNLRHILNLPIVIFNFWVMQDAQLSQRDRAEYCISFGQKWKTGTGRQYFTDIIDLSSTRQPLWHDRPAKLSNSVKNCKITAIKAFKVIEIGNYRKPVCDFQLVINSNGHTTSYRFGVIIIIIILFKSDNKAYISINIAA